jgi:hypothetical protein
MGIFRRNRVRATTGIEMDEAGVRKVTGEKVLEAVAWDVLNKVEILTTSDGPWGEDMFWVLHGADSTGVIVPSGMAPEGLVARLQALPGFDNEAVIEASGSTSRATFACWAAESS